MKRTFVIIQPWLYELGLDLYEMTILAFIDEVSRDGRSIYFGSWDCLAKVAVCSQRKVGYILNTLIERGFIKKSQMVIDGVARTGYVSIVGQEDDSLFVDVPKEEKPQPKPATRFVKPTIDEVRQYCNERGNSIDPEEFVNYYESKGWLIGSSKMKDWKACVRTWETSAKKRSQSNYRQPYQQRPAKMSWSENMERAKDFLNQSMSKAFGMPGGIDEQ